MPEVGCISPAERKVWRDKRLRQTIHPGVRSVLEIMALAAAVVVSFGAATLGSLAILEVLLRAAESADKKIKARRQRVTEELELSNCGIGSKEDDRV